MKTTTKNEIETNVLQNDGFFIKLAISLTIFIDDPSLTIVNVDPSLTIVNKERRREETAQKGIGED